jgi:hypothetical protein
VQQLWIWPLNTTCLWSFGHVHIISKQWSRPVREVWICGLCQDWWLAPSYGCIYLHDVFSLVGTNILSRNETNLSIWTCLVDCSMGIRSFLLSKVSKYNNSSMVSCRMVLHSGNPYSLTAWSYAVSSMFLSCMVLCSGDSCALIAGYFIVTSMFLSSILWQNHLRNEGFVSQDHIGGFSTKRECANTRK